MYGLVDAPLLWQICLKYFLVTETHAVASILDENYYDWKSSSTGLLKGECTAHVDDNLLTGNKDHLDIVCAQFDKRFGKCTTSEPPFEHVGLQYEKLTYPDRGYRVHQQRYARALKDIKLPGKKDTWTYSQAEMNMALMEQVGSLLYLCYTGPI